jgi:hypothetical protein
MYNTKIAIEMQYEKCSLREVGYHSACVITSEDCCGELGPDRNTLCNAEIVYITEDQSIDCGDNNYFARA